MSTNARIGMVTEPGSVTSIYTHWDGYVEHHGPILFEHYTEPEKVRALIALGDLSCFGETLGDKHDFDTHLDSEYRSACLAYDRDRGETDVGPKTHGLDDWPDTGAEFEYLFEDGAWRYRTVWPEREPWKALDLAEVVRVLAEEAVFFESRGHDADSIDLAIARLIGTA